MSHTELNATTALTQVPNTVEAAERLLADLRAEAAKKAESDYAERVTLTMTTLDDYGWSAAAIDRMIAAAAEPVKAAVPMRSTRGGMVPVTTRKDGTINTTLTGEGLACHNLADGTRTLDQIRDAMIEMNGSTPRGNAYTSQYVKAWLTSGANGKKGYTITFDAAGRVTSHAPG